MMVRQARIVLLSMVAAALLSAQAQAQSSSPSFTLRQSTINAGGETGVSPTGAQFRLTASLGQELAIGTSSSFNFVLQSGFWGYLGSGLVPVFLTVSHNPVRPEDPDLAWSGNNPPYLIYRSKNCAMVADGYLATEPSHNYTDISSPDTPIVCYSVLATAPGPLAPASP